MHIDINNIWVKVNDFPLLWVFDQGSCCDLIDSNQFNNLQTNLSINNLSTIDLIPTHQSVTTATKTIQFVGYFNAELKTHANTISSTIYVSKDPLPYPILGQTSVNALLH